MNRRKNTSGTILALVAAALVPLLVYKTVQRFRRDQQRQESQRSATLQERPLRFVRDGMPVSEVAGILGPGERVQVDSDELIFWQGARFGHDWVLCATVRDEKLFDAIQATQDGDYPSTRRLMIQLRRQLKTNEESSE